MYKKERTVCPSTVAIWRNVLGVRKRVRHKMLCSALAGVAQWIEHGPANQEVKGLIPRQGTCLGCRPQLGVCEATD